MGKITLDGNVWNLVRKSEMIRILSIADLECFGSRILRRGSLRIYVYVVNKIENLQSLSTNAQTKVSAIFQQHKLAIMTYECKQNKRLQSNDRLTLDNTNNWS